MVKLFALLQSRQPIGDRSICSRFSSPRISDPRQIGRQIVGHPVGEVLLLGVITEIGEGQA
jgi:hypothetical protein